MLKEKDKKRNKDYLYSIQMKVISFDVGIKNMAYCIFLCDSNANPFEIIDWNVVSLLEKEEVLYCNCAAVKKVKDKNKPLQCGRIGKFKKGNNVYCEKHAKSSEWIYPKFSLKTLKKKKVEDLLQLAAELKIDVGKKRADIMANFELFITAKCLEPIIESKNKNAGDIDLITIGKKMKEMFRFLPSDITHVLIENQISPLANRMKTVQGMLAQYFIMLYDSIHIDFISSANKLKIFSFDAKTKEDAEPNTESQIYKAHKKDGVYYSKMVLEKNPWLNPWIHVLDTKKKDDLADCFLQGLWYLMKERVSMDLYLLSRRT